MFPTATKEDQRRLGLHRSLHVDYRRKRMWVPSELADREERPRIVAGQLGSRLFQHRDERPVKPKGWLCDRPCSKGGVRSSLSF